ncbi:MAG TPA: hypothetical protein VEI97_19565, partial [bacterium]|nr:hypothetical protein [bacterium]
DGEPVAFVPKAGHLVTQFPSGKDATQVTLHNVATGGLIEGFPGRFLGVSPEGRWLATEGDYEEVYPGVQLWDLTTMQRKSTLFGGSDSITSIAFSPDSRLLAIASSGATVILIEDLAKL